MTERDERDAMLALMVDAFMANDDVRYRESMAWLRDYSDKLKLRRGRVRIGAHWFDPEIYEAWKKRNAARIALTAATQARERLSPARKSQRKSLHV
jgi:hypothetical protein